MTYGLEICPLLNADINDLESAHRANAKIVQWSPQKLPNPACDPGMAIARFVSRYTEDDIYVAYFMSTSE